jgi:hypothetical protein
MLEKDLDRTDIVKAKATVILTNKYSDKPHSTDHKNILLALGIKKYFLKKRIYDSTLFIQLIKPENKIHYLSGLESLSINNKISSDRMVILEEIKMNLLSKSCLIPGIIPLIANLVRSSGSEDETEYYWLNEYLEGSGQEIYRAKLNETFKNKTFSQISKIIYKNFDAIAFALEIEIQGKTLIILNPGGFYIEKFLEKRNDVKFYLYVICSDKDVADRITNADAEEVNKDEDEENNNKNNNEEYCLPTCKLGRKNTEHVMVMCDKCKKWYHALCVNETENIAILAQKDWLCPFCKIKKNDKMMLEKPMINNIKYNNNNNNTAN